VERRHPAAGVYVGAWDQTGNPVERARGAGPTSAKDGRFVLDLRESRVYTFMARDKSALLPVAGPRIEVGATPPDSILLVIQRDRPRLEKE